MSRIPFIEARFYDPDESVRAIRVRFARFLHKLRTPDNGAVGDAEDEDLLLSEDNLSRADYQRIERRAKRIDQLRKTTSGLTHLKPDDRERLNVLSDGVRLVRIPNEHRADEIAAELHGEMPWMAPATEMVWSAMRCSVREGWPGLRLPPLLLDGPPGIGKSHWARRLGALVDAPVSVIEATGENASFGVVGSQRGWSGAHPGRLIQTVLHSMVGNPLIVIDEIEKAGRPTSTSGSTFSLPEALLPLLEPLTARRWSCPYYQVRLDMSWVGWVLTSNSTHPLPAPLLSRLTVVRLSEMAIDDLAAFATTVGRKRGLSEASLSACVEALHAVSASASTKPNLRTVMRMLDRAADLENRPRKM